LSLLRCLLRRYAFIGTHIVTGIVFAAADAVAAIHAIIFDAALRYAAFLRYAASFSMMSPQADTVYEHNGSSSEYHLTDTTYH